MSSTYMQEIGLIVSGAALVCVGWLICSISHWMNARITYRFRGETGPLLGNEEEQSIAGTAGQTVEDDDGDE